MNQARRRSLTGLQPGVVVVGLREQELDVLASEGLVQLASYSGKGSWRTHRIVK